MIFSAAHLKPAGDYARQFGCKTIIYGPPGSAKTPLANTAPRPVMLACEPGLLSMRGSTIPTCQAFKPEEIDAFFQWFFNSNEVKNFDTLVVDSISEMATIYLIEAEKQNKHGLAAYGQMARQTMKHLRPLYYTEKKHTYLIAKQDVDQKFGVRRPYYPGQQLPIEMPHMYDFILRLGKTIIPGVMGEQLAFQCNGSSDTIARNRTGNLADYEPPHFGNLIAKAMN
jgi:hypothetical protein